MPHLFMIDLLGTSISEEEIRLLQHPNAGALLLFTRNFTSSDQLHSLVQTVQSIRPDIFIAVDHEGGIVQRFQRHGFFPVPAAHVYGHVFDLNPETAIQLAKQHGKRMAEDLLKYNIDLSLAPVLDLHHDISRVIGQLHRAFHHDPDVVTQLAAAFIQGMDQAGMPATGKHFPGHGSVASDSHLTKPISEASMETLQARDLKPFIDLINQNLLAAIMPAHVTYPAIDPDHPAGFSNRCLQSLLRDQLNFKGFVLSDCLSMTGADIGDLNTRANRALEAGCDMLIVCNQPRELLYQLLETTTFVQTQASTERLELFKQQMVRFSSDKKNKITDTARPIPSLNISEYEENHLLNKTLSV